MKKNSKKTKQILSLAMIGAISSSFAFTSPGSVSAAQISSVQNIAQQQNAYIADWREPFQSAYKYMHNLHRNYFISETAEYELTKIYQTSVEQIGSPTITNSSSLFVGRSTLTNNTNQDQTLTTNEFSKTFENSVTNSTTNGFNLGASASATFKIPLVGETSIELSTEYNFSSTEEKTKTESYTYTASAQNIVVPANSSVEVVVSLNTAKINGNVNLLSRMDGTITYDRSLNGGHNSSRFTESLGSFTKTALIWGSQSGLRVDGNNNLYLVGTGSYSAEYGTEFLVTVRPVEKPRGFTAAPSELTNEGYTYTVKPEVKKEQ
ncbi:ETX/MTX2 family pore-forming toxin [Bacillus cereus group sp. IBL03679]|uniref:ETX/MTX2 family pore-forming toxin n=1 Tax=Bacillus cereus group sp. IBL03679 TaxID=3240095 RepID=UPI003D2F7E20